MTSQAEMQAVWYISPTHHQRITSNSTEMKSLLETVLDAVPPSFHTDSAIKSLRTDVGFALITAHSFGGEALCPVSPQQLSACNSHETNPVQHSLKCFMRFYMTTFHAPGDTNVAAEAVMRPNGNMALYMEGLLRDCSQDLTAPCDGKCCLDTMALGDMQLEGLMYLGNLVTAYLLACMVGSDVAEAYFREQFREAWPRIQGVLSTGRDEAESRVPLVVKGGIMAHL